MRTVVVIQWGRFMLGPDNTIAQKYFSAGNIEYIFIYLESG